MSKLEVKIQEPTWTTEQGKVLLIKEMSSSHLFNAIRLLERTYWKGDKGETVRCLLIHEGYQHLIAEFQRRLTRKHIKLSDLYLSGEEIVIDYYYTAKAAHGYM